MEGCTEVCRHAQRYVEVCAGCKEVCGGVQSDGDYHWLPQ